MPVPLPTPAYRRLLVPPAATSATTIASAQATAVGGPILRGLPHRIPIAGDVTVVLVVDTGLATAWRDAPPTALVSTSRTDTTPRTPTGPAQVSVATPAPRLIALQGRDVIGVIPLVVGASKLLPDDDPNPGPRIEVTVRGWDLRAGSLVGPGDVGSRIDLTWRSVESNVSGGGA